MCECVRVLPSYAQIDYDRRRKEEFAYTWKEKKNSFPRNINPSRNAALIYFLFICFSIQRSLSQYGCVSGFAERRQVPDS